MTPEEAFFHKHITTTQIKKLTAEEIRKQIITETQKRGFIHNQNCKHEYHVGDRVLVTNNITIKKGSYNNTYLKLRNQKFYGKRNEFKYQAQIAEIRGNCYSLKWHEDVPEISVQKDQVSKNVPFVLFKKDIRFLTIDQLKQNWYTNDEIDQVVDENAIDWSSNFA
ncbi:UNKNOWN [Stylonychia lemnae]|uniref:Uncharacterized protein n=1 Tax=Stylonychia lemnae TaxID=5949 RepID=A0A078AJH0_STYLE|nr:UNKNOWN [Stylonychia lemnae]|eukprot:CDW80928.1 UNKNOWN [Stylonychia lemnae]